jgi:hypothetical protein
MAVETKELSSALAQKSLAMPTPESHEEKENQINIIKGLSTENDLVKIELRLRGYSYSYFRAKWVQVRKPIMNDFGIGNFMACLQALGDLANFSNYNEKDIPKFVILFFEDNYPTFIIYANEFELNEKDFNVVNSILKFYALSVLTNAKNAGHRNVVRGTLSENLLQRAFGSGESEKKQSFMDKIFRRNRDK